VSGRRWSLEAARLLLPEVRERTEAAVRKVEKLSAERDALAEGSPEHDDVDARMRAAISLWIRQMEALGLDVKGLWLVDFDNGSGYYCWRWPESGLEHFHGYDEGFSARIRIQ